MADLALGELSGDQTEKVLQFQVHARSCLILRSRGLLPCDIYHEWRTRNNHLQDLTGIEDLSVCRDVLQRHNWNLEVAVQVPYIISYISFNLFLPSFTIPDFYNILNIIQNKHLNIVIFFLYLPYVVVYLFTINFLYCQWISYVSAIIQVDEIWFVSFKMLLCYRSN